MIQRRTRDYEVSLWSLQDSLITVLKPYGLEYKGQIQNGKLQDRDDGTQTFSFNIPMYYYKGKEKIVNPAWSTVEDGTLIENMRKIKVIFNKDNSNCKIYEFLIIQIKEQHNADNSLYCNVECEGLAFHELGKIGYKISLTPDDFYNDDYDWSINGVWYDGYGNAHTEQPLANLDYWNAKVFSTLDNWVPEISMNWDSYSLYEKISKGIEDDYTTDNDIITSVQKRDPHKIYEDEFVDSWKNDAAGNLIPAHVTAAREKARVGVEISESNIYNITQTLAELFGVFCKYVYEYDGSFHIINRKVVYYNNFLHEQDGIADINYKYSTDSISRTIDSTDLVTKLFVKSVENSNSDAGITSIINVAANQSQEDYILNFDYLHEVGGINDQQYAAINDYIKEIRKINQKITPLSSKIISLQSELVELQAQLTLHTNAIAKDNEEIYSATQLLMNLTNNIGLLSVSNARPQTAVLFKDTTKTYDSYYVKITQKGVYSDTIHLYKEYNYSETKLLNEITTGQIEFDEYGNVIRVNNIFINEDDPKTIYLTYDYKPSLYYERIENAWKSRLMQDMAKKAKVEQDLVLINYSLYGNNSSYDISQINVTKITDYNLVQRYQHLLKTKADLIKKFNLQMGPAIREGYWQPETYTDYGDKYTDTLSLSALSKNKEDYGASGNAKLFWDTEALEGQQKLYYEYGPAQEKIAYPCINLLNHPQLLQFIKEHIDENVGYYFTPLSVQSANPQANHAPMVNDSLAKLMLVPQLYNLIDGVPIINNLAVTTYGDEDHYDYTPYSGNLVQKVSAGSYKVGYTYYYWQVKQPESNYWRTVTSYKDTGDYTDLSTRYQFFVVGDPNYPEALALGDYTKNIYFTHNPEYPWEIKLMTTPECSMEGWQFRLIMGNNKGINLNQNDEWSNGQYIKVQPTTVHLLNNVITIVPDARSANRYISNGDREVTLNFTLDFHGDNYSEYRYILEYAYNDDNYQILNTNISDSIYCASFFIEGNNATVVLYMPENRQILDTAKIRIRAYNITDVILQNEYYISEPSIVTVIEQGRLYYVKSKSNLAITLNNTNQSISADIYFAALPNNSEQYNIRWYKYQNINNKTPIDGSEQNSVPQATLFDEQTQLFKVSFEQSGFVSTASSSLIANWDGKYITAEIFNNNNHQLESLPVDYQSLMRVDVCLPVEITQNLQEQINCKYQNAPLELDFIVQAFNGTLYRWHINNDQWSENYTLSGTDSRTGIYNDQYRTTLIWNNNNIVGSTLHVILPANSDENYYMHHNTMIYCQVYNESDNYYASEDRQSYKISNTCTLSLAGTISLEGMGTAKYLKKDLWYPTNNPTKWTQVPVNILFKKYNDSNLVPTNITITTKCSIPVTVEKKNTIPVYNANNYTQNNSNNDFTINTGKRTVTVPIFNVVENIANIQNDSNTYSYPITIQTKITDYADYITTTGQAIFNTSATTNDKEYGYFFRLLVEYDYGSAHFTETVYVLGVVRQNVPEFNSDYSRREWIYEQQLPYEVSSAISGYTDLYYPMGEEFPGPKDYVAYKTKAAGDWGSVYYTPAYYDPSNPSYTRPTSMAACQTWSHPWILPVSIFNLNMASVGSATWDSYTRLCHDKIYTDEKYSYNKNAIEGNKYNDAQTILSEFDNNATAPYNKLTPEERKFWEDFRDGKDLTISKYISSCAMPGIIGVCYLVQNEPNYLVDGLHRSLHYVPSNTWGTIKLKALEWPKLTILRDRKDGSWQINSPSVRLSDFSVMYDM